jgi:SET domain-containing protein
MKNYHLETTEEFGRGLYASWEIQKDALLFKAELLVLSPSDTIQVNNTDLKYYTFKYNDTQDCLVLDNGEIFNHSDSPNVSYRLVPHENRLVMEFRALRDIKPYEQLFIDYNADTRVNTNEYKGVNLL